MSLLRLDKGVKSEIDLLRLLERAKPACLAMKVLVTTLNKMD